MSEVKFGNWVEKNREHSIKFWQGESDIPFAVNFCSASLWTSFEPGIAEDEAADFQKQMEGELCTLVSKTKLPRLVRLRFSPTNPAVHFATSASRTLRRRCALIGFAQKPKFPGVLLSTRDRGNDVECKT